MEINRDIGRVLLRLNIKYYEKGIKNISISIKGVRSGKIAEIDRKWVIQQIIKSKERNEFLGQFMKNISDEIAKISNQEKVKKIVEDPKCDFYTYENCDIELLYLYLVSLNDERYDNILKEILNQIYAEENNNIIEENKSKEFNELKNICLSYEKEIEKLKSDSRQKKRKIKELEMKCIILSEKNKKLKLDNEDLKRSLSEKEELDNNKENEISMQTEKVSVVENEKKKVALLGKSLVFGNIKRIDVDEILVDDFLAVEEIQLSIYTEILVYKKNIPIAKLRKIKKISGEKVVYFDRKEEIYNYLNIMGERE